MKIQDIKKSQAERGFTIVELLIVIVVIAVLAAITIVAYTGITTQANKNAGATDASTISAAIDTYYSVVGSYPALTGTSPTKTLVLTHAAMTANNVSVKIPANIKFTDTTALTDGASSGSGNKTFHFDTNAAGDGYCIGFWPTGSVYTIQAGGAAAGTMINDTLPTDCA